MTEEPSQFRGRIFEVLALIADAEAQRQYQQNAPSIDVPAELFNQWDDSYHPEDGGFRRQFDGAELLALRRFESVIDCVARETPQELPILEEFMRTDEWQRLAIGARETLTSLKHGQPGKASSDLPPQESTEIDR